MFSVNSNLRLNVFSGVPVPYALAWCGWRVTLVDSLRDSSHDLTKPASQQMVSDFLETADVVGHRWPHADETRATPPSKDCLREKRHLQGTPG